MAGSALTSTPFFAKLSRMHQGQEPYDHKFVERAIERFPCLYDFPLSLGLALAEEGNYARALNELRTAKERILLGLESRPDDAFLIEELGKIEIDIAHCENRL